METRLKERLTGAAILVALVVMLVPEMFHGQRSDVAASASSSGEGPPLRSYTIDLSNSPTRTAPLQSTPVNAASGAGDDDKPAASPQAAPAGNSSSNNSSNAQAAGSARNAPAAAAQPAPKSPAASPAPAPAPAPAAAAPAPAPAAPATAVRTEVPAAGGRSAAAAAHSSGGGWAVQLGLFAKHDNAERLVHSAQAKGFTVSISSADARGLYRVYAGGMADRTAAEGYAQRLKDQGLPAAVIAAP